jgi:hypothetical protein
MVDVSPSVVSDLFVGQIYEVGSLAERHGFHGTYSDARRYATFLGNPVETEIAFGDFRSEGIVVLISWHVERACGHAIPAPNAQGCIVGDGSDGAFGKRFDEAR